MWLPAISLLALFAYLNAQDPAQNLGRIIETTRGKPKLADEVPG
jgi:hypothetical protein